MHGPGRAFAVSASELATEVERELASGKKLQKGGSTYTKVEAELTRLREDNDHIIAQDMELKEVRSGHVAEEQKIIEQVRTTGDVKVHGPHLIDILKKIEDIDFQLAGLRCQQLENSRDISKLKREKVRIEKSEAVRTLIEQVDQAVEEGQSVSEGGPLAGAISDLVQGLYDEFDKNNEAASDTKKDIENSLSRLRSLVLGRRVRRGRINSETEALGGQLVSSFYELQRKNTKLGRLRDVQALNAKEINVLERAMDKLSRHARVRDLIQAKDVQKMEAEAAQLWEEIQQVRAALADLEAARAKHAQEAADAVDRLRAPSMLGVVTPETGELRERLIASLREEELCASRLAVLRGAQAQDIMFLGQLRAALLE